MRTSLSFLKALLLGALLVSVSSTAFANEAACEGMDEERFAEWGQLEPADPGYFRLGAAWLIYRKEVKKLNSFRNDKVAHCYIGCRITQDVDATTAIYVGWFKEKRDLTDCNPRTNFDPKDEVATRRGSELANGRDCEIACKEAFPRPNKKK